MNNNYLWFYAYLCILALTQTTAFCAANNRIAMPPVQQKHPQLKLSHAPELADNYKQSLDAWYGFFRSNITQHNPQRYYEKSLKRIREGLENKPSLDAHRIYLYLLEKSPLSDKYEKIVTYCQDNDLEDKFYDDIATQLIIVQAFNNVGGGEKAERMFIRLGELHPDNEQVAYFATMALLKTNQLDKAGSFIQTCLSKPMLKSKHFLFHFLQSKIYFQQNNLDAALESIQKSLTLSPKFPQALLFRAIVMEQRHDIGNAIKGYEGFVHATKNDQSVEKHIIQLLFNKGEYGQAIKKLEKLDGKTPDYFYDLALMHFHNKDFSKALTLIEKTLRAEPTLMSAILLKIKLLAALNKHNELAPFAQKLLIDQPNNIQILHTFLLLKNMNVPAKTLIEVGCAALKVHKTPRLIAAVADLCVEAKEVALAEKMYGSIIKHSKNPQVRARARYQTCYALFITDQDKALDDRLQEVLKDPIVDPGTYNLVAYHYATHNKNLTEALSCVDKALAERPDYPPYLDTKAYVLVKSGQKDKGLELLRTAQKKAPQDRIIAARLLALESGLWKS